MQTFITGDPATGWGVQNLDQKRLVKQLLECRQIMAALSGETKGWVNHPATKMWRGKESLLSYYTWHVAYEMDVRGYKWQNNFEKFKESAKKISTDKYGTFTSDELDRIIYTHRGRLYEKDEEYYAKWLGYIDYKDYVCCDRCNYYWPTHVKVPV